MNDRENSSSNVVIIVVIALAVLMIPCVLGLLVLVGGFVYIRQESPRPPAFTAPPEMLPPESELTPPDEPEPKAN